MTEDMAIQTIREAMNIALLVSAPILLIGLIIGLVVSIFQAVTQIQEQTLSFVPKILGMIIAVVILAPWLIAKVLDFSREMFYPG